MSVLLEHVDFWSEMVVREKSELEPLIYEAWLTSPNEELITSLCELEVNDTRLFLEGAINLGEFSKRSKDRYKILPGNVYLYHPRELARALFYTSTFLDKFSVKELGKIISHEFKHARTACRYSIKPYFIIQFGQVMWRHYYDSALTIIEFPEDMDEELARVAITEILKAPGEGMSEYDRRSLPQS